MTLTLTDMFCGAGGSSTGAIQVPGITVQTALNHWDLAIETHNRNHPDADHVQADILPYYGASKTARPTTETMGTLTTVDRYALVTLRGQNTPKMVAEPMDTVTAGGNHHGLMDVTQDDVMACRFRMLEPHEIKRGMAFPDEYVMLGTKREQVKMAGNAVTPPAARDLIAAVAGALIGGDA